MAETSPVIEHHPDFTIAFELHENKVVVNFKVYELCGEYEDGQRLYHAVGEDDHATTANPLEARVYCHGGVKWDGCSNWHFDEQDDVMLHFCGRRGARKLSRIVEAAYDGAKKLMGEKVCDDGLFEGT